MRHKPNRLPRPRPELQQLLIQPIAHNLIQRAERLIHQQNVRIKRQRPRNRGALLHPPRQLPRKLAPKAAKLHQIEDTGNPLLLLGARKPHDFKR